MILISIQYITLALVKALESYDPLGEKAHPKLNLIRQLVDTH